MRILVDARPLTDPHQGGVSRVAHHLITTFVAQYPDDEIILATTGSKAPSPSLLPGGTNVKHVHLHIRNKWWSLFTVLGLVALDREIERRVGKIDVVFLSNIGFVGTLQRRYVLLVHDLSFLIEPRWFSWKMRLWHDAVNARKLIQRASYLLSVSETTKQDTVRLLNIPRERVTVIPIGPTLSDTPLLTKEGLGEFSSMSKTPSYSPFVRGRSRFILALGWNDPRKNAKTAALAHEILKRDPRYADLDLVIVGRDVLRPSDHELASLYKNATAFLYPSWYEGYGLPLHEAATYGIPCVASTAGALLETAPPGTMFADPAKPHHWVEALRSVISASSVIPTGALAERRDLFDSDSKETDPSTVLGMTNWNMAAHILKETLERVIS